MGCGALPSLSTKEKSDSRLVLPQRQALDPHLLAEWGWALLLASMPWPVWRMRAGGLSSFLYKPIHHLPIGVERNVCMS